jgi:hypothetical protein
MLEQFHKVLRFRQDFEKYILEITLHEIHRLLEASGNNLTECKK